MHVCYQETGVRETDKKEGKREKKLMLLPK